MILIHHVKFGNDAGSWRLYSCGIERPISGTRSWPKVTCPECLAAGVADRIANNPPPGTLGEAFEVMWGRKIRRGKV